MGTEGPFSTVDSKLIIVVEMFRVPNVHNRTSKVVCWFKLIGTHLNSLPGKE